MPPSTTRTPITHPTALSRRGGRAVRRSAQGATALPGNGMAGPVEGKGKERCWLHGMSSPKISQHFPRSHNLVIEFIDQVFPQWPGSKHVWFCTFHFLLNSFGTPSPPQNPCTLCTPVWTSMDIPDMNAHHVLIVCSLWPSMKFYAKDSWISTHSKSCRLRYVAGFV